MTLEELKEQLQENLLCLTDEYLIDELDGYEGFDDEMCQIVADTVNKFIEVNNNNYQVIAEKFGEARESSYIYRVNKEINMKKIRVNTGNSKVINGKLFITLFKAQQIKSKVLQELVNYSSSILFPGIADRLVEYTGSYIRVTK